MLPPKDFQIGPTQVGMIAARTIFGVDPNYPDHFPPAAPAAEFVETLSGVEDFVGYGRTAWTLDNVNVSRLVAGRRFALGSTTAYSGECYIRTMDADGVYHDYRVIARFPNLSTAERMSGVYQNVQIAFILLEVV